MLRRLRTATQAAVWEGQRESVLTGASIFEHVRCRSARARGAQRARRRTILEGARVVLAELLRKLLHDAVNLLRLARQPARRTQQCGGKEAGSAASCPVPASRQHALGTEAFLRDLALAVCQTHAKPAPWRKATSCAPAHVAPLTVLQRRCGRAPT